MRPTEGSGNVNSPTWVPVWSHGHWPAQPLHHVPWPVPVSPLNGAPVGSVSALAAPPAPYGADAQQVLRESSVVWTPSGWQVPDTAQRRPDRGFWRTKPCRLYSQGICPHGEDCSL